MYQFILQLLLVVLEALGLKIDLEKIKKKQEESAKKALEIENAIKEKQKATETPDIETKDGGVNFDSVNKTEEVKKEDDKKDDSEKKD